MTNELQAKDCYRLLTCYIFLIWEAYTYRTLLWNESDTERPRTVDFHYKRSPLLVNKKKKKNGGQLQLRGCTAASIYIWRLAQVFTRAQLQSETLQRTLTYSCR